MALTQAGTQAYVFLKIQNGPDLSQYVRSFKWKSFINNGYTISARLIDVNLSNLEKLTNQVQLKEGRNTKIPLKIEFQLGFNIFSESEEPKTEKRIAYVTNLDAKIPSGEQTSSYIDIIAIDPPTWYLNRGRGDGSVYEGSVSDVIKKVINDYSKDADLGNKPGVIKPIISNTIDNKVNKWHMMRQDPKTFISTLLDWSSSLTTKETNWVVASVDERIIIREQAELETSDLGEYAVNTQYPGAQNVMKWERLDNNYLSNVQTRVITGGISAISGLYCSSDNSITEDLTTVDDDNTQNKKNVDLIRDQGFTKPTNKQDGITFVRSVPEDSAGAVGTQYQNYIDGRARSMYLGSLDTLQRLMIRTIGTPKLSDSSVLGASTVMLNWQKDDDSPFSHQGKWLVYGFEHVFTNQQWFTQIYLNRKDFDAAAQKVN